MIRLRARIAILLAAPLLAPLLPSGSVLTPPARADDVTRAEHTRLSEEMRKLAQRNAWSAVEANYRKLEELAKKGEVIDYRDHMLGAEAARALGDSGSCRQRLVRAKDADPKKEVLDWLSDMDQNFGRAKVTIDAKYAGDLTLAAAVPPFAPDQRKSLEFAAGELAARRDFDGLLPAGDYTVGGQPLSVVAGQGEAKALSLGPTKSAGGGFELAYVGPRVTFGVAFTSAGAVDAADTTLQAGAFSGGGLRAGVGVDVGITERVGIVAEVGYHDLLGAPPSELSASGDAFVIDGPTLHMGYGWLAGSLRFGQVWLAAGPVWGAGLGDAIGIDGSCLDPASACYGENGFTDLDGDGVTDNAEVQRLRGDVLAGGGAASVSYALVALGDEKKWAAALTLEGGAQTDSHRWYPWGQLALTVGRRTE